MLNYGFGSLDTGAQELKQGQRFDNQFGETNFSEILKTRLDILSWTSRYYEMIDSDVTNCIVNSFEQNFNENFKNIQTGSQASLVVALQLSNVSQATDLPKLDLQLRILRQIIRNDECLHLLINKTTVVETLC